MQKNTYKIIWLETAKNDLSEIIEYIKEDKDKKFAYKIFKEFKNKTKVLKNFPYKGRIIPELSLLNIKQYREIIYSSWRIFYKIDQKTVKILSVIDSRRDIEIILYKRILRNKT